jgi:hypothetical protein
LAGAAYRAAVNAVTAAIRSMNSGTTTPTETAPYMLWADTTTGLLKFRNAADNAWLVLGPSAMLMPRRGYLAGMAISNNVSDATNDIDIAAGECADSTSVTVIRATGAFTKRLDAAWAVGTGNGGLDTGAIANTTYHVFAIQKDSDGTTDYLFSASATAPTMPGGYTYFRRIGSFMRLAAAILPFLQDGDHFQLKTPILDVNATSSGTSAVTRTLSVPTGINVRANMNVGLGAASGEGVYLSDLALTDLAASGTAAPLYTASTPASNLAWQATIRTNTSGQIRSRQAVGGATETLRIATLGWYDTRGRGA